MSLSAAHESRLDRKTCQSCRDHPPALAELRPGTTLCFERYRAERERRRALMLSEVARPRPMRSPFPGAVTLSEHGTAHRRAMLAHLRRQQAAGRG